MTGGGGSGGGGSGGGGGGGGGGDGGGSGGSGGANTAVRLLERKSYLAVVSCFLAKAEEGKLTLEQIGLLARCATALNIPQGLQRDNVWDFAPLEDLDPDAVALAKAGGGGDGGDACAEVMLRIGDAIDCKDSHSAWLEAVIRDIDEDGRVKVHYSGWNDRFDEWLDPKTAGGRLAPRGSKRRRTS